MLQLIALVPLLPLIGFLINGIGNKSLSKSLVGIIGSGTMLLSFIISLGIFFELKNSEVSAHTFTFFD